LARLWQSHRSGDRSRMTGDCHVRFYQRLGVKLPRPTNLRTGVLRPLRTAGAAVFVAGGLMALPFETAIAAPSQAVLEYRHHMFDPPIMTLANRSIELMFDTVRVEPGAAAWPLRSDPHPLDLDVEFEGRTLTAAQVLQQTDTDALLVIKDGVIVNESYFNRTDEHTHFMSYSMAKTLNSVMFGFALQDGRIGSVGDPVTKYAPELEGSAYDTATLRDVLSMRSGSDWDDNFFRPGPAKDLNEQAFMRGEKRFVEAASSARRAHPPGEAFNYNTVDAAVIGLVIERATGMPISRYMSERLWRPAGMEAYGFYLLDGSPGIGREFTGGGFNAVLRDYGRIGLMMAQGGFANGRQLVPSGWVKESTAPTASAAETGDPDLGYAYLWWTTRDSTAYTALGGEGQFIFVDPATHTVVVKFSHGPVGPKFERVEAESLALLKAISDWQPGSKRPVSALTAAKRLEHPQLPRISRLPEDAPASYALGGASRQQQPLDVSAHDYVEEEYLVSGEARVFDWAATGMQAQARGPYTTRILVRRPRDSRRESGRVIVEPLNPSVDIDLPIMWAESHEQFMSTGDVWVGVTIKPNTIQALLKFDPRRYAGVSMANPRRIPGCPARDINLWSMPTTTADETGLAWDMLSQIGYLLKSEAPPNPLQRPAARLYMTGQSQSGGYARFYAGAFGPLEVGPDDKPLYDGYLYSGSPPWQIPVNQCAKDLTEGDPRLLTAAAGVPVIELFTEGDLKTNAVSRRPDSDQPPDLFRRYEIAGAAHVDPWEDLSFSSREDAARAHGRLDDHEAELCTPKSVTPSDFPTRYVFDAAWSNLDEWVLSGRPAPHAEPLKLRPSPAPLPPDQAFLLDEAGNALGGLRSPTVDVPTARWVGAKSGPFICLFHGYKFPYDRDQLRRRYGDHANYVKAVRGSVAELVRQRWLTPVDGAQIVAVAAAEDIP